MFFYFFVFILLIFSSYLVGNLYVNLFFQENEKVNKMNDITLSSLYVSLGLIIISSSTAIFFTFFKTLYIWPFILLLIPVFYKIFNKSVSKKNKIYLNYKNLLLFFLLASIVFIFHLIIFYNLQSNPFYDYLFFGKVSNGLINYNTENFYNSYGEFNKNSKQILYHFSELWLTGLLSMLTKLSATKILFFITFPIISFTSIILSIAIFSHFTSKRILYILGGVGLIYGTKLFLPISTEFWSFVEIYRGIPMISQSKLNVIFYLGLTSVLMMMNDFNKYSFIVFSFIPIFYPTTIPAFLLISFGLFVINFIPKLNFKINNSNKINFSWIILLAIVFIFIYKKIFLFDETTNFKFQIYSVKQYLTAFIETFIKVFIEHFIILFLFIYLFFKTKAKIIFKPLIIISLLGLVGSFVFVQLYSRDVPDINQVVNNVSPILITFLLIEFLKYLNQINIKIFIIISVLFASYNLSYQILIKEKLTKAEPIVQSYNFTSKIISELENNYPNNTTCCINKIQPARWYFDSANPFNFVLMSPKINPPLSIGILFYGDLSLYLNNDLNNYYPPTTFFKKNKLTIFAILKYLDSKKVNYLLIENSKSISNEFLKNFELICKDKKTQNTFWKRKFNL